MNYPIDLAGWKKYVRELNCLGSFGLALPFYWIYRKYTGKDLIDQQAEELQYALRDDCLVVRRGVYFKSEQSIPLRRITNLTIHEGPLMRRNGIRAIAVQTAGVGSVRPEARLLGIENPEQVREEILARINQLQDRPAASSS